MGCDADADPIQAWRTAAAHRRWPEGFELLVEADSGHDLGPADLACSPRSPTWQVIWMGPPSPGSALP